MAGWLATSNSPTHFLSPSTDSTFVKSNIYIIFLFFLSLSFLSIWLFHTEPSTVFEVNLVKSITDYIGLSILARKYVFNVTK